VHYDEPMRRELERLLQLVDGALTATEISSEMLSSIQESYNQLFGTTNPENQILVWGSLVEVLTSPYFSEAFDEDIEEESEEEEKPSTSLKEILDRGYFDENNPRHLSLAKDFLDKRLIC